MENGHPSIGLEDGTIDVERLLVEPQDEHLSMDSVISFNEKIPKSLMSAEDVSRSSGGLDTGIAQEGKDILNGEVLNAMPSEVQVGYFRLENDLCSMGEEYLLGVEFAESITNLDYGSSEGLHASASDSQVQVFTAVSDTECRSDLFRTDNLRECQIDLFNVGSSKLSDTPHHHECETLSGQNPATSPGSCTLQNSVKSQNSSSSSCQDVLSDENDGRFSQAGEMFCSSNTERSNDTELTVQDGATGVIKLEETLITSVQVSSTDILPTQKRSRKPTQRYICELADPVGTYPKRRREVSSSSIKGKSLGVKNHKSQIMGPKAVRESPEEFSVIAIQVPFGSLANKEGSDRHAHNIVPHVDCRNSNTKSKGKFVSLQDQSKRENCITAVDLKKRSDCIRGQRKTEVCFMEGQVKKKYVHATATNLKKRNECNIGVIGKKRDNCFAADCRRAMHQKMRDGSLTSESSEETSGRRKHHRLWTISEVGKLIDGVSEFGVGKWSRIKKLFFSASAHRTSVDLKDKWRNLLKASGVLEQGNQQGGKKRNMAWRPLPKSILRRVCELAAMYPYPKGNNKKKKTPNISCDALDTSTDMTLTRYRRILRSSGSSTSINGN